VSLSELLPAAERYSYVFDGSAQTLDHALASSTLAPDVTGIAYRGADGAVMRTPAAPPIHDLDAFPFVTRLLDEGWEVVVETSGHVPLGPLDPRARRRLIGLLDSFEHTKIIATHDLDMAAELCERTIVVNDGRIAADGPTREVFADAALLDTCGLEQPPSLRPCSACGQVSE